MRLRHWSSAALLLLLIGTGAAAVQALQSGAESPVSLPNQDGSLKFSVLGDFGTGEQVQYQLAEQMAKLHERFKYDLVVLVGDNLYGAERPQDFQKKFEIPYKPLLDAGVKFYASLGNHDAREQRFYKLFNMEGKLYYTFTPKPNVRFFALDSTYPEPEQIRWLEKELAASSNDWKIVFFHHPLYSSGETHGSDLRLRAVIEPLFLKYNVIRPQRPRPYLRARQAAEGDRVLCRWVGGPVAGGQHRPGVRHYGEGIRYRSGVHGR